MQAGGSYTVESLDFRSGVRVFAVSLQSELNELSVDYEFFPRDFSSLWIVTTLGVFGFELNWLSS